MVQSGMESHGDEEGNMQTIYKAAHMIRKSIANFIKATRNTNIIEITSDIHGVPVELYTMIHWIMIGPADILDSESRTKFVNRATVTVSQNIMYGFKSNHQINNKPRRESAAFRRPHVWQNPQVLGLDLTVHHDTRNKMLMDLLCELDYCVPYGRTLLMETSLADAVV